MGGFKKMSDTSIDCESVRNVDPAAFFEEYRPSDVGDVKSVHLPNHYVRNLSIDCTPWKSGIVVQEGSFLMTRNELLLLTLAFANIKQHDNRFEAINIPLVDLCRLAGAEIDGANDYVSWINTVRRLATRTLSYVEDGHAAVFCPYFSMCRVDIATKMVTLRLNSDLAPYFLSLDKNKTIFLYGFIRQLSSINACLLYLLCSSSRDGGYNLSVSLDHLKAAHGFKGETKHFISDILLPGIHEINQKTDITVNLAYMKQGRSITGICFASTPKSKKDMNELGINPENKKTARSAKRLSADEKQAIFSMPTKKRKEIVIGRSIS